MAMDVVTGAMSSLIPKLLELLEEEYKLQTGMKKKVQFLAREMDSIHALLRKVSDVPWDQLDEQVKIWVREAREASYDMEDILDNYLVRREPNDNPSRLKGAMKKMTSLFSEGKARHDAGSAIKDIKTRLEEVADRRARYRIDDTMVNPAATSIDPRLQAMYKEAANLVGIDKPMDDLISMLSSQAEGVARRKKTVAIVGIGGLGKTTLAKAIYDKIRADFECGAFVPVGRNPNQSKVLMDILYELDKDRFEDIHTKNRDARQLIDILREFLMDKRFFIVIDDIWETTSWEETLESAMLENNCGSRMIITTRNSQVAREVGDEVYKMPQLSGDDSKSLFYTRIFGTKQKWPGNEPDVMSSKFLDKCDGVPLAVITMASLLVGKPRDRWSDVFTSVGFGHKEDKHVDNTMKILSFSYYDMPAYLRTCLLYLSVFPEDYMIDKDPLIWRWIVEGFIQGKPGIQLFELGEQYFNELVHRSMIQPIENDELDGKVTGCFVHDMILDLIRSISSKENFVTILASNEGSTSSSARTARRIALHDNNMNITPCRNTVDMAQVRTFVAIRCIFGNWVPLSSCKLIRVLDLEGCENLRPHLVHLGHLIHLRYLSLKNCAEIEELPNEIGGLKFLKILNLENTKIRKLTPSISQLSQLVCLKGDDRNPLAPNWIGKLTSLEELEVATDFSNDSEKDQIRDFLKGLGSLRELRVFVCCPSKFDESMQRDLVLSLRNLDKLQNLTLIFLPKTKADTASWGEDFVFPRHLQVLSLGFIWFSCLPPCIGGACLPNLIHLTLEVSHMDKKDLEFLGRLPELCYLSLCTDSTLTLSDIGDGGTGYFRKLKFCCMLGSMIQLQVKEGDSTVSFCIWNGIDAVPFSCSEQDCRFAPCAVMTNLEVLWCQITVRALMDSKMECGNIIGLQYFSLLREVYLEIKCAGASAMEVDEIESALRKATEAHYNRPKLSMRRVCEDEMI